MPAPTIVTGQQLARRICLPDAPVLVDVRTDEDAAADPRFIPGAIRRSHRDVADWAAGFAWRDAVLVCQKGLKLSQGAAAWLRHAGAAAGSLEGRFEAWRDAGLPLVVPTHVPPRDAQGRTLRAIPSARSSDLRPAGPSGRMAAAASAAKPRAADAARPASEGHEGETFVRSVQRARGPRWTGSPAPG
jgi:rhodanese-related sulfurtransferase